MSKQETKSGLYQISGQIPVLLTAPHALLHKRPSLMGSYKQGEPWTDYIVKSVCETTGAYGIVATQDLDYDPNYHKLATNPFKTLAKNIVEENKIKYVLDIHGLSDKHMYDLGIYYMSRFPKSRQLSFDLSNAFNRGELRDVLIQNLNFTSRKQETLTEYLVTKCKVAGVQIEIARYIRESDILREEFVRLLSEYILKL